MLLVAVVVAVAIFIIRVARQSVPEKRRLRDSRKKK